MKVIFDGCCGLKPDLIHLNLSEPFERVALCSIAGFLCSLSAHRKRFEDGRFGTRRLNPLCRTRFSASENNRQQHCKHRPHTNLFHNNTLIKSLKPGRPFGKRSFVLPSVQQFAFDDCRVRSARL